MMALLDRDLLEPGPIRQVRLDLSSRCNLRCVYCAVSHPDYAGADMSETVASRATDLIGRLATHHPLGPVDLNGHGETTYRKGWTDAAFALIDKGVKVRLTSNFAKAFSDVELEALACMEHIAISIDTADRQLLQAVRRRVDVRQILLNIIQVRATAIKLDRAAPKFTFSSGLYDKSAVEWEAFARFAIACGVDLVEVWNLKPYEGLDVAPEEGVTSLDDLSDDELAPRMTSVLAGVRLLRRHQVEVHAHGDFIAKLARRVGLESGV